MLEKTYLLEGEKDLLLFVVKEIVCVFSVVFYSVCWDYHVLGSAKDARLEALTLFCCL